MCSVGISVWLRPGAFGTEHLIEGELKIRHCSFHLAESLPPRMGCNKAPSECGVCWRKSESFLKNNQKNITLNTKRGTTAVK